MQEYYTYRKDDGMILVCQNNDDQSILIYGMNDRAKRMTHFDEDYVKGRNLTEIVPRKIREHIEEYLEFQDKGSDLQDVVNRMRDFRLLTADGDELEVDSRVIRVEAQDQHDWFRIILRDSKAMEEVTAVKNTLKENFKGHEVIDPQTGLPDRASMLKDMELAHYYATTKNLNCCFAAARVDQYDELKRKQGKSGALQVIRQAGANIRRNLREDDTVGSLSDDTMGVILTDITQDSSRVVLNRLRWLVASEAMLIPDSKPVKVSISLAFTMIKQDGPEAIIEACESELVKDTSGNTLSEL